MQAATNYHHQLYHSSVSHDHSNMLIYYQCWKKLWCLCIYVFYLFIWNQEPSFLINLLVIKSKKRTVFIYIFIYKIEMFRILLIFCF